eukprot:TRINITY_DN27531_c0_g1_i1.p1 TRINITY_DN27531_c0_g1~~TRINITY_DN27531_c0_g1_i1.p1  ORF type:complete len:160 (+),score=51.42 TRINITY_DN27531_c0_g1_i1:64-543(+)
MKRSALLLRLGGKKWNQGTTFAPANPVEPWSPIPQVFAGENRRAKRTLPSFMKEEWDFDSYTYYSWMMKNMASMNNGSNRAKWVRSYQKLYEAPGGVPSRTRFHSVEVPIWPDRKLLPRVKGYRDSLGYYHDDEEQLFRFEMPDMTDTELKPYVIEGES